MTIRTREPKLRGSDFPHDRSLAIHRERYKRTDVEKVTQSAVLVRLENGGQSAALGVQLCEEVCCHRLAVHHEVVQMYRFSHLLVGCKYLRNAVSQMQIAAMGGNVQGVSLLIVQ